MKSGHGFGGAASLKTVDVGVVVTDGVMGWLVAVRTIQDNQLLTPPTPPSPLSQTIAAEISAFIMPVWTYANVAGEARQHPGRKDIRDCHTFSISLFFILYHPSHTMTRDIIQRLGNKEFQIQDECSTKIHWTLRKTTVMK